MSSANDRPTGMSQLDWLWTNFSSLTVSSEASSSASDEVILTEKGVSDMISEATGGLVSSLAFKDNGDGTVSIVASNGDGTELSVVTMPEEVHVSGFSHRTVTQKDVNAGCEFSIGTEVLSLTLTDGTEYLVSLKELGLALGVESTNTIEMTLEDSVVSADLRIDTNSEDVINLKTTKNGVYADLQVSSEDTGVELVKGDDGLYVQMPLGSTGNNIRFQQLTLSQYLALEDKESGTVYFISDYPYIYLDGQRYGINMQVGDTAIISLSYDSSTGTLSYRMSDESDERSIVLGFAGSYDNGLMSADTYNDLLALKNALDGITDMKEYVTEQVNYAGFKLEYGEETGTTKPLNLVNNYGTVISSIDIDLENYLQLAESRIATEEDVEASGGSVTLGDQILILTMTSGDVIYVDLNDLVDVVTTGDTKTVSMAISASGKITSDVNISSEDKMLYAYDDGLSAILQPVREPGKIVFYGKSQTEDDYIGEVEVQDSLVTYALVESASLETYEEYPPRNIDGEPYVEGTHELVIGESYFVLVYKSTSGTELTDYEYNDFISLSPFLNTIVLSSDEGNILTKDSEGYLYSTINWIEVE